MMATTVKEGGDHLEDLEGQVVEHLKNLKKEASANSVDETDKTTLTAFAENLNALQLPIDSESIDLDLPHPPPSVSFDSSMPYLGVDDNEDSPGRRKSHFDIVPNTPAYHALMANAEIRVTRLSKLTRKAKIQKFRKAVKKAAALKGINQSKRGKPPRVPLYASEKGLSFRDLNISINPGDELEEVEEVDESDDLESLKLFGPQGLQKEDADESLPEVIPASPEAILKKELSVKLDPITDPEEDVPHTDQSTSVDSKSSKEKKALKRDTKDTEKFSSRKWKRGQKKKKKKDRNYVKGKVIDGEHELYALSLAVMLGLRTSIGRTNGQLIDNHRWLDTHDFMAVEKYAFPPNGGPKYGNGCKTPPHELAHTFKIKDYSPMVFAYIRRMFGVNEYDFLASVCGNANYIEFISNAKSGQFFFYSRDGKYMIKTMTNAESKFLRRILPHYFRHCARNPNTLITKFFGMYRVKMYHLRRNVKFVIMNSVYDTDKTLQSFFDLKGSKTGRDAKPGEDVKKDNDVRASLPENALALPPIVRERMRDQISRDCSFLKHMKIMDYSMLIAVHHIPYRTSLATTLSNTSNKRRESLVRDKSMSQGSLNWENEKSNVNGSAPSSPSPLQGDRKAFADQELALRASISTDITLEDEDDELSYLDEYMKRGRKMSFDEETGSQVPSRIEIKKREATEQMFWPFHILYDIQGRRLMTPYPDNFSSNDKKKIHNQVFVTPISNRVDAGLVMDTTGIDLPKEYRLGNGKVGLYEGKIFYMGIIDVLQQYNARKRLEARYRRMTGSGWKDASCVHPNLYADRFVEFFDEYSTRTPKAESASSEEDQQEEDSEDLENVEEITFENETILKDNSSLFSNNL